MNKGVVKPTVKSVTQLSKTKSVAKPEQTQHSAFSEQRSRHYHDTVLAQADNTRPIKRLNPTKTRPNSLTVSALPGLAN
jgi:hypothetical protein